MRRFHHETYKRATLRRWSEHTYPGQFGKTFHRVASKLGIVRENCGASDPLDVINGGGETDRAGDIRRAGLESVRRFFEGAFFQGNADDHFAAAVPRRNRIENLSPSVERSDSGRST